MEHRNTATRTVDKAIYLSKASEPKEIHRQLVNVIQDFFADAKEVKCLDAGCAAGAFLSLLRESIPYIKFNMTGLDVHEELLEILRKSIPHAKTINASLENKEAIIGRYDLITCLGVLSIFDDFEEIFLNLYNSLEENGILLIETLFNEFPIDMIVHYRDLTKEPKNWEKGWNVFSKLGVETILSKYKCKFEWIDFKMPFQRPKTPNDPMRTWTIATNENPFQLINGGGQLVNQSILKVVKNN